MGGWVWVCVRVCVWMGVWVCVCAGVCGGGVCGGVGVRGGVAPEDPAARVNSVSPVLTKLLTCTAKDGHGNGKGF